MILSVQLLNQYSISKPFSHFPYVHKPFSRFQEKITTLTQISF